MAEEWLVRVVFNRDLSAVAWSSQISLEKMPIRFGNLEVVGNLVRAVSVDGRSKNQFSRLRGEEIDSTLFKKEGWERGGKK